MKVYPLSKIEQFVCFTEYKNQFPNIIPIMSVVIHSLGIKEAFNRFIDERIELPTEIINIIYNTMLYISENEISFINNTNLN